VGKAYTYLREGQRLFISLPMTPERKLEVIMGDDPPSRTVFVSHDNCWGKYEYTSDRARSLPDIANNFGGGNFVLSPHTTQVMFRVEDSCRNPEYGIELHVLDSTRCGSASWREANCQVQALLANGKIYSAYCKPVAPTEPPRTFLNVGDTFGIELDYSRREGIFVVNGTRLSHKFALPLQGVTLQVRLHERGAVSILPPKQDGVKDVTPKA